MPHATPTPNFNPNHTPSIRDVAQKEFKSRPRGSANPNPIAFFALSLLLYLSLPLTVSHASDLSQGGLTAKTDAPFWPRHTIDAFSAGADGVRLLDVNQDGLLDIATGWEEGNQTKAYLNPGDAAVRDPWPSVIVGSAPNVEDAVFIDLDNDGATDVLSSCEGKTQAHFVHWAPHNAKRYLKPHAWKTEILSATAGKSKWMFALPLQVDGQHGPDLIVGSKEPKGQVSWLQAPQNPRNLSAWKLHKLYTAGWIMSIRPIDIDRDGDQDLLITDRKGENSGLLWLENPGPKNAAQGWAEHRIGADGLEVLFLDVADIDSDGLLEIAVPVKDNRIHLFQEPKDPRSAWPSEIIEVKIPGGAGRAKAVRFGDLDQDGFTDIAYSCENATPPKQGILWLKQTENGWLAQNLSGPIGIKYDRIELLDMDNDGDLDLLTCEERHNNRGLGLIWHENPLAK